jgi:ABC-type Na+ transport system ATPase subunit NatA
MMKKGKIVDDATPLALSEKYGRANLEEVFIHIARQSS